MAFVLPDTDQTMTFDRGEDLPDEQAIALCGEHTPTIDILLAAGKAGIFDHADQDGRVLCLQLLLMAASPCAGKLRSGNTANWS